MISFLELLEACIPGLRFKERQQCINNCIIILLFVLLLPIISAAQNLQPFSGRVSVSISADENISGKIESYIGRELRSLGDIVVTDDRPRWHLSIVALETSTKGGYKSGVELSIVILEPFDNQLILEQVNEDSKKLVSKLTSDLYSYSGHWIMVGAPEDLKNICEEIVAKLDSEHINPARRFWQSVIDYQK